MFMTTVISTNEVLRLANWTKWRAKRLQSNAQPAPASYEPLCEP
jgi:hypothetical protein